MWRGPCAAVFPDSELAASERASRRWLASYVDQLVSRDVSLVGAVRDPMRLRHYLQAIAASTAGTPTLKTLIDTAGIERPTANAYDALLERLLITERIPSWSSNRLNRLIRLPKRYLVDPAFIGPLLGVDARAVLRDGDLLGKAAGQLRHGAIAGRVHGERAFAPSVSRPARRIGRR